MELNLSPIGSGKLLEIYAKKTQTNQKINEFVETLGIWKKAVLLTIIF